MDSGRGKEVWENENIDLELERFIKNFVKKIESIAKSNKESFTLKTLRGLFDEKEILEG